MNPFCKEAEKAAFPTAKMISKGMVFSMSWSLTAMKDSKFLSSRKLEFRELEVEMNCPVLSDLQVIYA